ncbi:MAG TPA: hypothetical protein VJI46_04090 [Candidatus Nanoarchaeia archaeon]|nr:hypothetical protein [Candidatus Nanoarchaeia archaeon]
MAVVGFGFNKINVTKSDIGKGGKINISNNVSIVNIEPQDVTFGKEKQNTLKFSFEFTSKYDPEIGSIMLGGSTMFMSDPKRSKEIMEGWKKDKRVPKEIMTEILNTVLTKCNVQALILSQDVNLPPPIPLPKIRPEAPKE